MDRAPQRRGSALGSACVAVAFTLGAFSPSRPAFAAPQLQAVAETAVGYTDNAQSAPSVPVPGGAPRSDGAFLLLRPGVVLASASPRAIHRLTYTYTYDLYFQHDSASTSSNQLEYRAFFDLSPRVSLVAGAYAIQSNLNSALLLTPPGAGAVNATSSGSSAFLAATADELVSVDLGPGLLGYEGLDVTEQTPLFDTVAPRTFLSTGRVGVERGFLADAVGVEARASYSLVEGSFGLDGAALGAQRQTIATGVGSWRHDWGRDFASRVEAGALEVQRLNTGHGFWQPAGSASLAYVTELGDAELAYAHTVTTNPLVGQTMLIDEVRLRGSLPLTKSGEVLLAASSGYQWARILDENATLAGHVDAILADVGVGWKATDLLFLGIRYQHVQQITDTQAPTLPLSFVRNSVMIGATFRFPADREMPRAYRSPRRVDRTDEIRDAVEPSAGGSQQRPAGGGT